LYKLGAGAVNSVLSYRLQKKYSQHLLSFNSVEQIYRGNKQPDRDGIFKFTDVKLNTRL